MNRVFLKKYCKAACAMWAILCLSGCDKTPEYPEGAEGLPTYTTTESVKIIYDTAPTTAETEYVTTSKTTVTTTVPETVTTTEETSVCETETETVTETTTVSVSLDISDVPDVGISEYYDNTQTQRTVAETTETPVIVTEATVTETSGVTSETTSVTTAASSVTSDSVITASASASASTVTSASTASVDGNEPQESLHVQLTDGRISSYTGREIISHPYSYYTLSDKHRRLYDKVVTAMLNHEDRIEFDVSEEITFDELFDTYQLIYNDEYRLFYISPTIEYITDTDTGFISAMKCIYRFDAQTTVNMRAELEAEAYKILSQITPQMNDYDIVKLFHDSVISSCTYKETENQNTVYGCLVEKQALCQAYSRTFTYLCSEAGIESLVVLGVANEPHMWNIVKMGDDYYHIDLTWDDPDKADKPDSVRYDYFGLTDERIRQLRQVDDYDYTVPAANGTKYQYYFYNNLVAASTDEAEKILEREVLKAAQTKSSTVQFMCADDSVYTAVTGKFFTAGRDNVIDILDRIKPSAAYSFNTDSVYHNSNKSTRTVKIFLDYTE